MNDYWTSPRVTLRPPSWKDAAQFYKWGQDVEAARCCDRVHFPNSMEQAEDWIKRESGRMGDLFRWVIEDRSGNAVGTINTFDCDRRNGTFKYGLSVDREHWGQGYAQDSIRLVLRYYFMELGYQKVTPHVYEFNERSVRLHEKMGFQLEGRLRSMMYTNGRHYDELHFGLTRDEFAAIYPH